MSEILVDNLTGKTSAGSIVVYGEGGTATTNLQQGLAKVWINFQGTGTIAIRDDFGASTIVDNGTGDYTVNFTNSMGNSNYLSLNIGSGDSSNFGPSGETKTRATGSVRFETRYQGNNVVYDHEDCYVLIHGDLS